MMYSVSKTAIQPDRHKHPTRFYSSAREGMFEFLRANPRIVHRGVLMPAFIGWSPREGSGVFDPIVESGSRHDFYALNSDLSIDLESLEKLASTGTFGAIVLIHYFGRTQPEVARVRQLADLYDLVVVEDLAHGYFSARGGGTAGTTGDVLLYSLHKMFPLPDGGQVTYRAPGLLPPNPSSRPELAEIVMSYDWDRISQERRGRFVEVADALKALPAYDRRFRLHWPDLGAHDVPQTLPVTVIGAGRDGIYTAMNERGFGMVSLYHTLIPAARGLFPAIDDLAAHIINFPVHQDVMTTDVGPMVDAFNEALDL
jgi:dTDP-4-amino-4,6-dideoxygalactose transaminase